MPLLETQRVVSQCFALFEGDQPDAAGPFYRDVAEKFGKQFDFAEIAPGTRADGTIVWVANHGRSGAFRIERAQGSLSDLVVDVVGTTHDARAALNAVWEHLSSKAGQRQPLDRLATICDQTTAVVVLDVDFTRFMPVAAALRDAAIQSLVDSVRPLRAPLFRFTIDIPVSISGRNVSRSVTFEPRATASPGRRVFYTQSPLPSEEHLKLIERIAQEAAKSQ
jgi:hypothetical protein